MKRIILILLVCVIAFSSYAQKQTINNGDSGLSVRTKLNSNFTEVYNGLDTKSDKSDTISASTVLVFKADSSASAGKKYATGKMLNDGLASKVNTTDLNTIINQLFEGSYVRGNYMYRIKRDSTQIATTLKTGLVSTWEFDETTGTNLVDSKGGHNGTASAGVTVNQTGKLGKCILFNGTTGVVNVSHNSVYNLLGGADASTKSFSYSAWVKLSAYPTAGNAFVVLSKLYDEYNLRILSSGFWQQLFDNNTITGNREWGSGVTLNTWTFVTVTVSNGNITFYENGNSLGTAVVSGTGSASANNLQFGSNDNNSYMNGYVDQIAIWNKVLTPTEVALLYNSGSGLSYTNW